MTVSTFYPTSCSPMTGGGVSTTVNPALLGVSASTTDGADGAMASAYFNFGSIPTDATINSVKLECRFGWADDAPAGPIFVYGRTDAFGYMWGGGSILPAGWDEDFAGALYDFTYSSVNMTQSALRNTLRVDFGGKGRFDYIRVLVDWTAASPTPPPPGTTVTPHPNLSVASVRTSGSTVAAGGTATTAIVVTNSGDAAASAVVISTTSNATVQTRTWVRNDTGATGTGQVAVTVASLGVGASVTVYVTDVIKSDASGGSYACAGTVTTTSEDNLSGSPLAFSSGAVSVVPGKETNPDAENSFDEWMDAVWPPFVATHTIPNDASNPNWECRYARVSVSGDVYMTMAERNYWVIEMQVGVKVAGVDVATSNYPTHSLGTAAGGRTEGGGRLYWEQLVAVAPGNEVEVTLRGRMHGQYSLPASTENHVYVSPFRVEIEPRN